MPLNKSKGNMYPWVTHTWNIIKGKCPHDCSYCYMKKWPQSELHFDEKELTTDLGSGNTIFVGSSCDMWGKDIPFQWIEKVLYHCRNWNNKYLFQTKNPARFIDYTFPDCILGTTIESDIYYPEISKAPAPLERKIALHYLPQSIPVMVSIEPIMEFNLETMVKWMQEIKPQFVSIGADSQHHNLPEPSSDKVKALIEALKEFTEVKIKDNLKRVI